uniref:Reverse transcriptase Ty1/copia-type domain-containing protein n=1 Tax=Chromera velia CCMP2878 TaxID=1169474 RepID=A0A0K6S783_9ALVE|eukprot:Cvel_18811.t1-p1 / transcript=Cvel_18811.t1 / gene=Cvel_18811 / organism=Chromera_velia_CCMP2878 / gene_product=hypothetical protein / transcript_product=hypothetical protein / location=Cvel_scaffold1580:1819-2631(-) / protein_length=207 / sequence_SO=supercontig / SO=protein_coding / is_pseudo=false
MAFTHSDFDPRKIVVADVKTAYLTALRSDSLYIHPLKDYPDHEKFQDLWLFNRALYGLRDSGNLWDRSRNKTLAAAGWVPSSVRGIWWKWTGKPEAPTSRLLGILPTFVDDFAILPIDSSASVPSSVPTPPPDLFPLPPSSRELPSEPPRLLTAQEEKAFRKRLGCLSWVARDTRPDLSQGCNQLSHHSSAPTHADADYLLSLLHYA